MEQRHVWISMDDGDAARRAAVPARRAPGAGHRRRDPVPHGRPHGVVRERVRAALRGGRLRRLPARPSRDGLLRGDRARRVPRAGAGRHLRGDRVARRRRSGARARSGCTARRGAGSTRSRSRWSARPRSHAIVPIYASDDRYTDDVHYMGGILKAIDLVDWVIYMAACNVLPPVPAVYGDGWREEWLRRIEGTEPWLLRWLEEQDDGPYWRHGSLRPGLRADHVPDDDRRRLGRRLHEHRAARLRGVDVSAARDHRAVGAHVHGHVDPGPAHRSRARADPLVLAAGSETSRTASTREPPLAVFMRRSTRPAPDVAEMRGEWRSEPTWPAERLRPTVWRPDGDERDRIAVRGDVGTAAWISCAGKPPWTLPDDQREDDALSLDVRLAARGGARAPRPPATSAHDHVAAPRGVPLRAALRRLPRRRIGPREPRRPESHPPREPLRAEAARAGRADADRSRARGDVLDLRGGPSPAARARGLRLAEHVAAAARRLRSTSSEDRSSSSSPSSTGRHRSRRRPSSSRRRSGEPHDGRRRRRAAAASCARSSATSVGRQTRVVTSYGSRYDGAVRREDRGELRRARSASPRRTRDVRGRARRARYAIEWPEATVATEAHLELRSTSSAYHVVVEVIASEDGPTASATSSVASSARSRAGCNSHGRVRARSTTGRDKLPECSGATSCNARSSELQRSSIPRRAASPDATSGQRGWNRHPEGIRVGSGASP